MLLIVLHELQEKKHLLRVNQNVSVDKENLSMITMKTIQIIQKEKTLIIVNPSHTNRIVSTLSKN